MGTLLTTLGEFITASLGWIGEVIGVITAQPLLLIPIGMLLVGFAVGIISRLFSVR